MTFLLTEAQKLQSGFSEKAATQQLSTECGGRKKMWWVQYQESGPSSMRQSLFGNISETSFRNPCYSLSLKCATQAPIKPGFNTNPGSNHWHTLPPWTKPLHLSKPLNGEWKETFPRLLLSKQHKVTNATSKVSKTSPLVWKGHLSTI